VLGLDILLKTFVIFYGVSGYVRNEEDGTVFALIEADETIFPELIRKNKKGQWIFKYF